MLDEGDVSVLEILGVMVLDGEVNVLGDFNLFDDIGEEGNYEVWDDNDGYGLVDG